MARATLKSKHRASFYVSEEAWLNAIYRANKALIDAAYEGKGTRGPRAVFKSQVQEDGSIFADSENFITNTKAAIKYYSVQDNPYNSMYFIGDNGNSSVEFSIGAIEQKNDANVADKIKIDSHGFDRFSFRKDPSN